MKNQCRIVKYKIGDIIIKIDPRISPVYSEIYVITDEAVDRFSLKSTLNYSEMWFFKEGVLLDETKLKMNSVMEFHYYPNEKNKTKNR